MNELSGSATPYDLNVLSNVSVDGDSSILEYLASKDADLSGYAENMEQISIYEADFIRCVLWNGIASATKDYCHKGEHLSIPLILSVLNLSLF